VVVSAFTYHRLYSSRGAILMLFFMTMSAFAISLILITTVLVLDKVMSSSPGFEIATSVTIAVVQLAKVVVLLEPVTFPC
jgi:hypothetical protein